jgi:hypothetical protein
MPIAITTAIWTTTTSALRGASAGSTFPVGTSGNALPARILPSARALVMMPNMSGTIISPPANAINSLTLPGERPVMSPAMAESLSISRFTPMTTAIRTTASRRMIRMTRCVADLPVGARGELRTRSIHDE